MDKNEILQKLGIAELNEMQKATLDAFPHNEAIVLLSPTGTGKTLAFLLPLTQVIDTSSDVVQAVVIVPSRELALQIDNVIKSMGCGLRSVSCYGGRPAMDEHRTMNGVKPHIVIATPGRMNDHLQKRNIEVADIKTLVIDEFDKCLELGFHDEMREVISQMPLVRKRMLTSATDNENIPDFAGIGSFTKLNYLDNQQERDDRLTIKTVHSPMKDKLDTLGDLLQCLGSQSSIVFLNYRDAVERVYEYVKKRGFHAELFHGGLDQQIRERSIYKFSNGTSNVLVSTDLSARGLDIPDIDNIIHYHLPTSQEAFVHRNGRTARWDARGNVFIILNEDEEGRMEVESEEFYIPKSLPPIKPSVWTTLYIGKGKKDKLSKMDVLGFLCKVGGLTSNQVGRIDVKDHYCFVAIERKSASKVLASVRGQKIKGVKTIIQEAR